MRIVEFLARTVDGKLSLDEQKKYLSDNAFPPAEEIAEAVDYMYGQMPEVPDLPGAIDICGTGGSGLPRLNVSTISAFIVAGAGVKVAKHGNNAASGKFGSFDLLSALDVPINLSPQELQLRFNEYNLAFLYAKSFHPAMRFFAPVRAELGKPCFFNILGPLLSPVRTENQLIGTPKIEYARLIAEVSRLLGKQKVIVAVGSDGLDEITLNGATHIVELSSGTIREYDIGPEDLGVEPVKDFSEIATDPEDNLMLAEAVINGDDKSRLTDLVLVNSAMALYLAEISHDLKECYKLAKQSLESGRAKKVLEDYRMPSALADIIARDHKRDFTATGKLPEAGKKYKGGLIAEIKRASPSEGTINASLDIAGQARIYERAGASAISVLTESEDFGGNFEDLTLLRKTVNLPLLCKDFIIRKEHIYKAKSCGADMILLIANILQEEKLRELYDYALGLGLQVLVEVHSEAELEKALQIKPEIIGVNSRNLHDFSIDTGLFEGLARKIPEGIIKVAESGIGTYADVPKNYDGILVGTVLMRHPFPQLKIKELLGRPLLKLCGMRSPADAKLCEELGVDMIGINFVPRSRRKVSVEKGREIAASVNNTLSVGVFEDQPPEEVNHIAEQTGIKVLQLSGHEGNLENYNLPVIKTIRPAEERPKEAFLSILDNAVPGSGKKLDAKNIAVNEPSLIAGGVDEALAGELFKTKKPLGIDTASGIETDGEVDPEKIRAMYKLADETKY
ncbi:MAG TPA: anthranilate phosphoribosyltransferase [Candidatus Saccharimonadales bacterium]|nr:anthranilate phosphoribosyltransferase [Candidatus Saccharimonadales bacterium]